MNFSLQWDPQARRIIDKVDTIVQDPFHYLEHFEGQNLYKLRIGDYRALIEIDFTQNLMTIRCLDHRKRVYKEVETFIFG